MKNNPFTINKHPRSSLLYVAVAGRLRDKGWAAHFGEIQRALREKTWQNSEFSECRFNIDECSWIDPTPLLSILIALFTFCDGGGKVEIIFPGTGNKNGCGFLEFLAQEGFLNILKRYSASTGRFSLMFGKELISEAVIDSIYKLEGNLSYRNCRLLPASIFYTKARGLHGVEELATAQRIDDWVEQKINEVFLGEAVTKIPLWACSGVKSRLQTALRETLHNILEHAYGGEGGYAGLYVRYRRGFPVANTDELKILRNEFGVEGDINDVPLLPRDYENRTGFIEVFVIDSGCGICYSLSKAVGENLKVQDYVLAALRDGKSSKRTDKRITAAGGLKALRVLLEPHRDSIRIRDAATWWGAQLPFVEDKRWTVNASSTEKDSIQGLAWAIRISWDEYTDIVIGDYWREWANDAPTCVIDEFTTSIDIPITRRIPIVDMRFNSVEFKRHREKATSVVLLPPERFDKNNIVIVSRQWVTMLASNGILVIGDISPNDASIYISAFDELPVDPYFKATKAIVLITRRLHVCVFERRNGRFSTNPEVADKYLSCEASGNILGDEESIVKYLRVLRAHESKAFWAAIQEESQEGTTYLRGKVEWGKTIMDGYLDFAQTLTNQTCQKIYESALWRLPALFSSKRCHLKSLDQLTDSLIERFNAFHPGTIKPEAVDTELLIGSIQVSGMTERLAHVDSNQNVWHFFRHPDATAEAHYLLLWPQAIWFEKFPERHRYERVGRTPVIARDGWKAYPMPRFRQEVKGQEYVSVYESSPKESYAYWQDRDVMKIGHWVYGGHHDLLTLNLIAALEMPLDHTGMPTTGDIAKFIYQQLFNLLDIPNTKLSEKGREIAEASHVQHIPRGRRRQSVLIYPSHPVTDHIINCLMQLVSDDYKDKLRKQLVGILPIRRPRSGSTLLISGLVSERLEQIARSGTTAAVIFDDAMLTGRTYYEIKRLLKVRGFTSIRSLIILDRQRLPSSDYIKAEQSMCYWRLDVPPLGGESSCLLCQALSAACGLMTSMNDSPYLDRLIRLVSDWEPRSPVTGWADGGLTPIPISLNYPRKKFGIRESSTEPGNYIQAGGDEEKVYLTTSTGLVAYVTEFHSMTSRDDLPLILIRDKEKGKLSPAVVVELVASQLLLFPNEFDQETENEMVTLLMDNLLEIVSVDRRTALALLALLSRGKEALRRAAKIHLSPSDLAKQKLDGANADYVLFMSYLIQQQLIDSELKFERAACPLKGAASLPVAYWHFHIQIKDIGGRSHRMPLHRLQQGDTPNRLDLLVLDAVSSASRILSLLDEAIKPHGRVITYLEETLEIEKTARDIHKVLIRKAREYLDRKDKIFDKPQDALFLEIQDIGNRLLVCLNDIHRYFFQPIGLEAFLRGTQSNIHTIITSLCSEAKSLDFEKIAKDKGVVLGWQQPTFDVVQIEECEIPEQLDKYKAEVFIIWDDQIRTAINDLLVNVVYATAEINSPWPNGSRAHLCIGIRAALDYLEISLVNKSSTKAEVIEGKAKNHRCFYLIKEINGCIIYANKDKETIEALVRLPYANKLFMTSERTT